MENSLLHHRELLGKFSSLLSSLYNFLVTARLHFSQGALRALFNLISDILGVEVETKEVCQVFSLRFHYSTNEMPVLLCI